MAVVSWANGRKKTLTIASAATTSDVLDMGSLGRRGAYRVGIISPAALTGTITLEVSDLPAGPFRTLQSDAVDINLAAAKATVLDPFPFPYVQLKSTLSEGANRDFIIFAYFG